MAAAISKNTNNRAATVRERAKNKVFELCFSIFRGSFEILDLFMAFQEKIYLALFFMPEGLIYLSPAQRAGFGISHPISPCKGSITYSGIIS